MQKYTERLNYWEEQRKLYADDVDIDSESGIINIEIDEFVPCLRDIKTGEIKKTFVKEIPKECLNRYTIKNGWNADWKNVPQRERVYGVYIDNEREPQGLISIFYQNGGNGTIYGYAANENVLKHYIEKIWAKHLPIVHEYQFVIEYPEAIKLLEKYNYETR